MTDEQQVDPRYDRAFQRGFEGAVASGVRNRTSVRRTALVAPAPYRASEPEPKVEEYGVQDVAPTRSSAEDEPDAAPDLVPARQTSMRDLTRNPFLIVLTLLGVVMVVGGIAWANQGRQLVAARGGASDELDYWFLQSTVIAAPVTILTGIAILAGVLFVAATAWNRR